MNCVLIVKRQSNVMGNLQGKVHCKVNPERVRSLFCGESYVTFHALSPRGVFSYIKTGRLSNARIDIGI